MRIELIKTTKDTASADGRALLDKMTKEIYGKSAALSFNENGKPLLDFCFVSISHSGERVAAAVSENQIGIDIEEKRPIEKRESYKLFSDAESEYANKNDAFLVIWTRKEAYIKALGGVLSDMNSFSLCEGEKLLDEFSGYKLSTEEKDGYILSIAQKNRT